MLTLRIICNFLENLFSGVRRSLDAFFAFMRPTAVATAPDLNLLHASATGLLMVQEQQTRRLQMVSTTTEITSSIISCQESRQDLGKPLSSNIEAQQIVYCLEPPWRHAYEQFGKCT